MDITVNWKLDNSHSHGFTPRTWIGFRSVHPDQRRSRMMWSRSVPLSDRKPASVRSLTPLKIDLAVSQPDSRLRFTSRPNEKATPVRTVVAVRSGAGVAR